MTTQLRRARVAAAGAFLAQGLLFAVLLTHLPQFKDKYHVGDGVVTVVILCVSLLAGAGSVLAENLAKRIASAHALQLGLLTIGVAAIIIGLAPDRPLFFLGFGIYGVGLGAVDAGSNMQAVTVQHRYGRSILTSFHAVWSAAGIVGALYVAGGERIGMSLTASIVCAAVLVVVIALVAPRGFIRHDDPVATVAVARMVPWRPVLLLGAAMVCFYVADAGTSNWSAIYLHDVLHASDSTAALAYAAYQGTSLVSRISGDHVVRRFGITATVRFGAVVGAFGLLVAVVASGPWTAIVGFAILGIGLPVVAPLCFSAAGTLAPGAADVVVARVNVFNYLGAVGGGVLVGAIGTLGNLRIAFVLPLLLALALLWLARAFVPSPVAAEVAA